MHSTITGLLALLLLASANAPLFAQQQWGDIKGRVIWNSNVIPPPKIVNNKGCPCAKPVIDNGLIINPKNNGVQNVVVWLIDPTGKRLPIHPKLNPIPANAAIIDQPCCLFEPRVTVLRAGQPLEIRNSSPIAHNSLLVGKDSTQNLLIGPGKKVVLKGNSAPKAEERGISMACNIHGWMAARIFVFDHPYCVLTDADGKFEIKNAPAGNYVILVKHELGGWLHSPRFPNKANNTGGRYGEPIAIPSGKTLEMKPFKFDPKYLN